MAVAADRARRQIIDKGDPVLDIVKEQEPRDADLLVAQDQHDAFQDGRRKAGHETVHHAHQDHEQQAHVDDLEVDRFRGDPAQILREEEHDRHVEDDADQFAELTEELPHPGKARRLPEAVLLQGRILRPDLSAPVRGGFQAVQVTELPVAGPDVRRRHIYAKESAGKDPPALFSGDVPALGILDQSVRADGEKRLAQLRKLCPVRVGRVDAAPAPGLCRDPQKEVRQVLHGEDGQRCVRIALQTDVPAFLNGTEDPPQTALCRARPDKKGKVHRHDLHGGHALHGGPVFPVLRPLVDQFLVIRRIRALGQDDQAGHAVGGAQLQDRPQLSAFVHRFPAVRAGADVPYGPHFSQLERLLKITVHIAHRQVQDIFRQVLPGDRELPAGHKDAAGLPCHPQVFCGKKAGFPSQ